MQCPLQFGLGLRVQPEMPQLFELERLRERPLKYDSLFNSWGSALNRRRRGPQCDALLISGLPLPDDWLSGGSERAGSTSTEPG